MPVERNAVCEQMCADRRLNPFPISREKGTDRFFVQEARTQEVLQGRPFKLDSNGRAVDSDQQLQGALGLNGHLIQALVPREALIPVRNGISGARAFLWRVWNSGDRKGIGRSGEFL